MLTITNVCFVTVLFQQPYTVPESVNSLPTDCRDCVTLVASTTTSESLSGAFIGYNDPHTFWSPRGWQKLSKMQTTMRIILLGRSHNFVKLYTVSKECLYSNILRPSYYVLLLTTRHKISPFIGDKTFTGDDPPFMKNYVAVWNYCYIPEWETSHKNMHCGESTNLPLMRSGTTYFL